MKQLNAYVFALGKHYESTPKAVLAAVAVSAQTCGGDQLEHAATRMLREWWALYEAGIVAQRPRTPKPPEETDA